jgi:AcrR family transcriptional regulator
MGRPQLTRARIVAAAVELADREGLGAVTLRRLASQLRVHVTSLYNHVQDKDEVLDGIVESLIAEANLPTGNIGWDQWIRQFAAAIRAVAHRHPGAFTAFHHRAVHGRRAAESTEAALAAFLSAGFSLTEACGAIKSASLAVLGLVLDDLANLRTPGLRTDLSDLAPERFPLFHEAKAIATQVDASSYLIDALVKGFAANLRASKSRQRLVGSRRMRFSRAALRSGRS